MTYDLAHCSTCGAPIFWAVTEASLAKGLHRSMPIDIEPVDGALCEMIGRKGGQPIVRVREQSSMFETDGQRFNAHFVTCPDAEEHRR